MTLQSSDQVAERGDMVSLEEAAALAGMPVSRLRRWATRRRPRAMAFQHANLGYRLPSWQFDAKVFPVVKSLAAELQCDAFGMLVWLETPLGALAGLTPRAALEQGADPEVLLALARHR